MENFKGYFLELEHELKAVARDQEAGYPVVVECLSDVWYNDSNCEHF